MIASLKQEQNAIKKSDSGGEKGLGDLKYDVVNKKLDRDWKSGSKRSKSLITLTKFCN